MKSYFKGGKVDILADPKLSDMTGKVCMFLFILIEKLSTVNFRSIWLKDMVKESVLRMYSTMSLLGFFYLSF